MPKQTAKRAAKAIRNRAAAIILEEARLLKEGCTVHPHTRWGKDEHEAKATYGEMISTARALKRLKVTL